MTSGKNLKNYRFFLKNLLPFFIVAGLYPVIIFLGFTAPDLSEGLTRLLILYNISFVPIYLLRVNLPEIKNHVRSFSSIFSMFGVSLLTSILVVFSGGFTRPFSNMEMILKRYKGAFDSVGEIIVKWIVLIPLGIIFIATIIQTSIIVVEKIRALKHNSPPKTSKGH